MTEDPHSEDPFSRDPLSLWQEVPKDSVELSLEDIRARASKLQSTVRRRNLRELGAFVVVTAVFGFYAIHFDGVIFKTACGVIVLGGAFVMWFMFTRAGALSVPTSGAETCLAFHRKALETQRDLLRSVWRWYVGPFVPGLILFQIGSAIEHHTPPIATAIAGIVVAAVCTGVVMINLRAAQKLQRQIDSLPN